MEASLFVGKILQRNDNKSFICKNRKRWEIVEARKEKPFESFEDITKRIPSLNNPAEMIVNRVKQELDTTTAKKGKKKYYLFTPIPKAQKKHRNPRNSRNQRK